MRVDTPKLNIIAEFCDPAMERAFFGRYILSVRQYIAYGSLVAGLLFFGLGFFDLFILHHTGTLVLNFSLRGAVLALAVAVFFIAHRTKRPRLILYSYLALAVFLVVSYQALLSAYYTPGVEQSFMEMTIAFIVIDLACFLLPNRWIYSLVFAIGVAVMFLGATSWYMEALPSHQVLGVSLYFLFVIILGGMFSRSLQVQRRMHYFRVEQLEQLSSTDRLTGVYNRQKFDEVFSGWLGRREEDADGFSTIMFDLDNFKKLNDTYGHLMGDEVLVGSVDAVREGIRTRDIFARWGGEEFMILLPGTSLEAAAGLAERLRATIEGLEFPQGARTTASFGVTAYQPGDTTDSVIIRVDECMYRAKQEGKNRVCVSTPPDAAQAQGGNYGEPDTGD